MKTKTKRKFLIAMYALIWGVLSGDAQTLQWADDYQPTGVNDGGADVHVAGDGRVYVCGIKGITNLNPDAMLISYTASGTRNWVSTYSGSAGQVDAFQAVTSYGTGSSISIYATGYADNTSTAFDALLVKYNQSGTQQWYANWDAPGGNSLEYGSSIAVDGSGNIYVCGKLITAANGDDLFVLKYNSSGSLQWSTTYNSSGTQNDDVEFMKINSAGTYLYITSIRTISSTNHDAVLQKVSTSTGAISWTSVWDNSLTNDIDETYSLDIDPDEHIYTVGKTQTASNGSDALMLQYNSSGTLLFTNTWNNSSHNYDDVLSSVCVTKLTHTPLIYVTGYTQIDPSVNDADILTMKFGGTSVPPLWMNTYDGTGTSCPTTNDDWGYMIMVDAITGKVFVSGKSYEFGESLNATTVKYNAGTGAQEWIDSYDSGIALYDWPAQKYPMDLQYDSCYNEDHIYIAANSMEDASYGDAKTLKYGYSGTCRSYDIATGQKKEIHSLNSGVVYPNPFNSSAVFECTRENIENASFVIYDITGCEVKRIENINTSKFEIDSKQLNPGIYFYKFLKENESISAGKFVVEN